MDPIQLDFPTITNNNTYKGRSFEIVINDVALDLTGATIEMHLKEKIDSTAIQRVFKTGGQGITITDAVNGKFRIDKQFVSVLKPGTLVYDLDITLANGDRTTWYTGIWKIRKEVTLNNG